MELKIHRVQNASKPEGEYVILEVLEDTNLHLYAVVDTTFNADDSVSNEFRHIYFFPAKKVKKGEYVVLTSSTGTNGSIGKFKEGTSYYEYFWQSKSCIWNDSGDNASLIEYYNGNTVKVPAVKK